MATATMVIIAAATMVAMMKAAVEIVAAGADFMVVAAMTKAVM